jgi:ribosomally synthesized peptide (two-chain TOMM family)
MSVQKSPPAATADEIQDWETIWIQAVARAWKDEAFASRLTASQASARAALLDTLQYELPAGIELNIVQLSHHEATSGSDQWGAAGKSPALKGTATVTLPLPPKPTDLSSEATSLSDLLRNVRADGCMGACF